jgi:tRNA(Ile)-lysidine synthase
LAVSGGGDSTALLLMFHAVGGIVTPPVVATVDHGVREEAADEARTVAGLCDELGLAHTTLKGELPDRSAGSANLSARARDLRYALLHNHAQQVGARWIVTAHHADDQLETLIMRLNRGSGVGGLASIRSKSGNVVRPLLTWTRNELQDIVVEADVEVACDPSNVDDRFDRARLRQKLKGTDLLDARAAARSASALAEANEAIEWSLDALAKERCRFSPGWASLNTFWLPAEYQRRLAIRCLRHVDPEIAVRGDELTRLLDALRSDRDATLGNVQCSTAVVDQSSPVLAWTFQKAPPRRAN